MRLDKPSTQNDCRNPHSEPRKKRLTPKAPRPQCWNKEPSMTEKSDSHKEQRPVYGFDIIGILRDVAPHWFKPYKKREIHFPERFLYCWLGSTTFFVMNIFTSFEFQANVTDLLANIIFITNSSILAVYAIVFALMPSLIGHPVGPVRLYFSGFLTVYVPWMLIKLIG